jgi:hypothetical protein
MMSDFISTGPEEQDEMQTGADFRSEEPRTLAPADWTISRTADEDDEDRPRSREDSDDYWKKVDAVIEEWKERDRFHDYPDF